MEIKPEEVAEVKIIGKLNGDDVKVVRTLGGFNVAMGKKDKYSLKAEALAAGSHIGLVAYQVEKMHGHDFEAAIYKSESEQLPLVEDKTESLPDLAKNSGIEMYVLCKSNTLDFIMCKNGIELAKYETDFVNEELNIKKYSFRESLSPNRFLSQVIAKAIDEKMTELGLKKVNK